MHLVKNKVKYWEFIRRLRNDEKVKIGFINQDNITVEQQLEYMGKYNDNYYICVHQGIPLGYIGQVDGDIRLAVTPAYHGQGVATFMLTKFMTLYPEATAKVKLDNIASNRLFPSCGFVQYDQDKNFFYYKL